MVIIRGGGNRLCAIKQAAEENVAEGKFFSLQHSLLLER
jgi:hypothetical protein